MIHAVLAGKVERAHDGSRVLALGNEEADRGACIDVLEDLRAHHELAAGSRLFEEEIGEIDRAHFGAACHFRELAEGKAAKLTVFGFEAEVALEDGADLRGVDAKMDARCAELERIDFSAQDHQGGGGIVRGVLVFDQFCDGIGQRGRIGDLCVGRLSEEIGRIAQHVRVGKVAVKASSRCLCVGLRRGKPVAEGL